MHKDLQIKESIIFQLEHTYIHTYMYILYMKTRRNLNLLYKNNNDQSVEHNYIIQFIYYSVVVKCLYIFSQRMYLLRKSTTNLYKHSILLSKYGILSSKIFVIPL